MSAPSPRSIRQKLWIVVRFVVFGCVGFYVLLFGSAAFMARVMEHTQEFVSPFLSLPLTVLGALMMLYGAGEWGRWGYLLVFLSIPVSLFLLLLIDGGGGDKMLPVMVAGVAALATYAGVRAYYARTPKGES